MSWDAQPLKSSDYSHYPLQALVDGGYTVFVMNHRAAPRFRYPANIEDAQRAVRFVRSKADEFGIDPDLIGAFGGSSGGYLSNMLGLEEASPAYYVSSDDPPVLLVHGDADETVLYEQSVHLFEILQESGVTTNLITIPGGGHGASILVGDNPFAFHQATVDWFDRFLRSSE